MVGVPFLVNRWLFCRGRAVFAAGLAQPLAAVQKGDKSAAAGEHDG